MIKYIAALLLVYLTLAPVALTAAERGVISQIDYQQREFTLAGKRYAVPPEIRVRMQANDTSNSGFSSLADGLFLQLRYVKVKGNNRKVVELIIIPQ